MRQWLLVALGGVFLLLACSRDGATLSDRVVAQVGGEPVTRGAFERFYETWRRSGPSPGDEDIATPEVSRSLRLEAFQELIQRLIFLMEAARLGLTVSQEEVAAYMDRTQAVRTGESLSRDVPQNTRGAVVQTVERVREDLLIQKLLREALGGPVSVTGREIRTYYRAHRKEFKRPVRVRAQQIVVATREEAEAVRQALEAGKAFEELARERSLGPESEQGGDLGWFSKGEMPMEFERAIFSLRVGRVSPVIQTPYGYHIFKLTARRRAGMSKLKAVRQEIHDILSREKRDENFYRWKETLQERFRVLIQDTSFLDG